MSAAVKLHRFGKLCRAGLIAVSLLASLISGTIRACPICGQPTITLTERLARSDVALLVQWVSSKSAVGEAPESTTYEVVQVHRDGLDRFKSGQSVTVNQLTNGKPGNLYLLMGQKTNKGEVKWELGPAQPVSETSYQYVIQAPPPEAPAENRLSYFIKFLEFPDFTIANDAFAQFVNAPTKEIFAVADKLPREKLRRWLADPKTPPNRRAGYGLMLGMSGNADDARFLEKQIATTEEESSLGVEGLMFGYLLLTGEQGLEHIEATRLTGDHLSDGEVYGTAQAIRYFWSYGNGQISRDRLRQAMHRLLDRPALAEIAITDLARWKDWDLQPRLMELYRRPEGTDVKLKEAIIRFMIAGTKDLPKDSAEPPEHVLAARKNLEELRQLDPKLVASSEKFFNLK